MKPILLFSALFAAAFAQAQDVTVHFQVNRSVTTLVWPLKDGYKTKNYSGSSQTSTTDGIIKTTDDAQVAVNKKLLDSSVGEGDEYLYTLARIDYNDTFINVSGLVSKQKIADTFGSYDIPGSSRPNRQQEIDKNLFDKQASVCSMSYAPKFSYLSEQARRFFAFSAGLNPSEIILPAKSFGDCLKASLNFYAQYSKFGAKRTADNSFELFYVTRGTKDKGFLGLTQFETKRFSIQPKTQDPVELEAYGKTLVDQL